MNLFLKRNESSTTITKLFHGSNSLNIIKKFNDNQFFTTNDYIAMSYAYNGGGLYYEVEASLNPLIIKEDYNRMPRTHSGHILSGTDSFILNLLGNLYGEKTVERYEKRGIPNSLSYLLQQEFGEMPNYTPLIEYAKKNGYNSLIFNDESFDTFVTGDGYIIFDGSDIEIKGIYDITEHFESRFVKEPIKIQ